MNEFRDIIEQKKKAYIAEIQIKKENYKEIVIYGAGKIGKMLQALLQQNGIIVSAFCVTELQLNRKQENGIPVLALKDFASKKNEILFLIGTKSPFEIINELKRYDIDSYIDVPDFVKKIDDKSFRPTLEITPKIGCSINCKYCPQEVLYHNYFFQSRVKLMSFETFKKCVDKTPQNLIVEFAGFVEPFLNSDAVKMMEYVNITGRDMTLFTTLVGLDREKFNVIKGMPFIEVVLHLPDKNGFANIPMDDQYLDLLDMVLDAKKSNGMPFVDKATCQSEPHSVLLKRLNGRVLVSWNLVDRAGNLEGDVLKQEKTLIGEIYCDRAVNLDHNILLPDGTVVLCCMDFGMQHRLGNLLHESYESIVKGKAIILIKRKMAGEMDGSLLCRSCTSAQKSFDLSV
jgi:hypothetical protein